MRFSERHELAKKIDAWCMTHGVTRNPEGALAYLNIHGYLKDPEPKESEMPEEQKPKVVFKAWEPKAPEPEERFIRVEQCCAGPKISVVNASGLVLGGIGHITRRGTLWLYSGILPNLGLQLDEEGHIKVEYA